MILIRLVYLFDRKSKFWKKEVPVPMSGKAEFAAQGPNGWTTSPAALRIVPWPEGRPWSNSPTNFRPRWGRKNVPFPSESVILSEIFFHPTQRCTVVGNPGEGGSLGFFGKFFWGGYLGLWENQGGGVVFYCIFMWKFFKNLYRGYMRCPPSPPLPPLCASMILQYLLVT
jgi:hypothetical protein